MRQSAPAAAPGPGTTPRDRHPWESLPLAARVLTPQAKLWEPPTSPPPGMAHLTVTVRELNFFKAETGLIRNGTIYRPSSWNGPLLGEFQRRDWGWGSERVTSKCAPVVRGLF